MKKRNNADVFNDSHIKVPFVLPEITNEDKKAILSTLNQNLLTDGPKLREFENKFAKFTGAKYAIGVSNATAALQLSLKAIGIGKGDEVIIPDLTFVASANAILFTGATPIIADIDKEDYNISIDSIKKSLTNKTKAIMPVHFTGKSCKMHKIRNIAKKNNLRIIEDCAHAIGSRLGKKHVGTFGDAGCFSFYPTKNITTLEGGMVITNSRKISEEIKALRNHGITKSYKDRFTKGKPWEYDVIIPGYNYRLDEIRSALGISQLKRIAKNNLKRKKAALYYNSKLKNNESVIIPKILKDEDHACHLYVLRIKENGKFSRDYLFQKLLKNGIRSSVHYKPIHEFTAYKKNAKIIDKLDNSKLVYKEMISLPLYPQIKKKQQNLVLQNF
jgi:dTDP-4-amino-4,6-dideoxygalactose transaminase|tara:strand:- start:325 stop:1485 length:1161 start_codon:yes stop_codon:yes gene_type:complete